MDRVERVPDLGDLAHLLVMEDGSMSVRVVEGGAVVTLSTGEGTVCPTGWTGLRCSPTGPI
ncbi:hypothetical protein [Streptomyces globisporus]|uniref:hypothetical protein n=1 Tax=Streptomyces globisporus TaxID=1908 RepID=UPI00368058EF